MVERITEAVRRVRPSEFDRESAMGGISRQEVFATQGLWAGLARTASGGVSEWHHHGSYESVIYILSGTHQMEFGPGGADSIQAEPGDFIYVAAGAIHREINVGDEEGTSVVVRAGSGEVVINVDGPERTTEP